MKKAFFYIFLYFYSNGLIAQNAYFNSLTVLDGPGQLHPTDMVIDKSGNRIIVGTFYYKVDLDPGPDSAIFVGDASGLFTPTFIVKLDSNGNHLWSGVLPKTASNNEQLAVDHNNNVFIAGQFRGVVDFDISDSTTANRTVVAPYYDGFVLKLDSNGAFQWVNTFGRTGQVHISDMEVDHAGKILLTGSAEGTNVVFHPNVSTPTYNMNNRHYYVLKYNQNGSFAWVKPFGKIDEYRCREVEVTSNNDVLISGSFSGTIDFDPGSGTHNISVSGFDDLFILKLTSSGNFSWAKRIGGIWHERVFDMEVDDFDNLVMTGYFRDSVDFDPGPNTYYERSKQFSSKFVLKLDAMTSSFKWVRSFVLTDPENVEFYNLHTDKEGGIYTTGAFKREFYVHPDTSLNVSKLPSSSQSTLTWNDAFIHKFDSSGIYQWAHSVHANEFQHGKAVRTTDDGRVVWLGKFINTPNFGLGGPNIPVACDGGFDGFLLEMKQCAPVAASLTDTVCKKYISISGDTISQSGNYQIVVTDTLGCDSVLNLDLTVIQLDTNIIRDSTGLLMAQQQNVSYQWLDCGNSYAIIQGETNRFFNPISNGSYAVVLANSSGCIDTSSCISVNNIGLNEQGKSGVIIYPNPTSGNTWISFNQQQEAIKVSIFSIDGRKLSKQLFEGQKRIPISLNFEKGTYLVHIVFNDEVLIKKVLVN